VFAKNADAVIIRILMDLSPDGTTAFLANPVFWEALELAVATVAIFETRRFRRDRIFRDLLRATRPPVVAEFYRILDKLPAICARLDEVPRER
jgi:hypothetical protein